MLLRIHGTTWLSEWRCCPAIQLTCWAKVCSGREEAIEWRAALLVRMQPVIRTGRTACFVVHTRCLDLGVVKHSIKIMFFFFVFSTLQRNFSLRVFAPALPTSLLPTGFHVSFLYLYVYGKFF